MDCPYSDEELQYFDGVNNPMGDECRNCQNFECEHNFTEQYDDGPGEDSYYVPGQGYFSY